MQVLSMHATFKKVGRLPTRLAPVLTSAPLKRNSNVQLLQSASQCKSILCSRQLHLRKSSSQFVTLNMNKKWSSERIIKFLEAYERYTCLWDVHSPYYKNKNSRDGGYRAIAKIMDIEVAQVKAKVRSIRNAYTLELAKIAKSRVSGTGTTDIYKPRVAWFSVAHRILHQVVKTRESQSAEIGNEVVEDTQSTATDELVSAFFSDSQAVHAPLKRAKTIKETGRNSSERVLKELKGIADKLSETLQEENEFDCFGKSVACQLKKLPEDVALQAMAYVQSYLVEQRLKCIAN